MRSIPDYGDVFTIADFEQAVKTGLFVNDDGSGYYSNGVQMSDERALPSEFYAGRISHDWSHVVWFNK